MKTTKKILGIILVITISFSQFVSVITAKAAEDTTPPTTVITLPYTDSGLNTDTTYHYTVKDKDDAGNISDASGESLVLNSDEVAPSAPTEILSSFQTDKTITLHWTGSTDNIGVTEYEIYRDGTLVGSTTILMYKDSGLQQGTSYTYTIKAKDAAGNTSDQSTAFTFATLTSFPYTENTDGSITITGYNGEDNTIVIPASIDGKTVTGIGEDAFRSKPIVEVSFEDTISNIGKNAFYGCGYLETVSFPSGIGEIGIGAFSGCSNLQSIIVQGKIDNISEYAFAYSSGHAVDLRGGTDHISDFAFSGSNFTTITINSSVNTIGKYAFSGVTTNIDNIIIGGNVGTIDTFAFYNSTINNLSINGTVTEIGYSSFSNTTLGSIEINGYINTIDEWAFSNSGIGIISFPYGVGNLGTYAFLNCVNLKTIEGNIGSIGNWAFQGCSSLESIAINDDITSIGGGAFSGTVNLKQITIRGNVGSIGDYAFSGDSALTSVNITGNITNIGNGSFAGTAITELPASGRISSIGDSAFEYCSRLSQVPFQSGLTAIGVEAFGYNTSITSITIPSTVTYIGNYAFRDCTSLTSVTIPSNVTNIGEGVFTGCTGITSIITPPTAPTNVTCSSNTETTITLTWTASTDDVGVTGYDIYRDSVLVGNTADTTYTDTELSMGITYVYTIKARDAAGNISDASAEISYTIPDTVPPSAPTSAYYSLANDTVKLKWTGATDNAAIQGYVVMRDFNPIGFTSDTAYTDDTVTYGEQYNYQIYTKDASENCSESYASINNVTVSAISNDTTPPSAPTFTTYELGMDNVVLHWDQSTDNVDVGGYIIYRNGNEIGFTQDQSYTDINLTAGQTYDYFVKAMDMNGNLSRESNTISFIMPAEADISAPSMPGNLTCTINSDNTVDLSWDASTDNVGVKTYAITRNGEYIGQTMSNSYTDSTAEIGQLYFYIIGAIDPSSNISFSFPAIILVTDQTPPTSPSGVEFSSTDGKTAVIKWNASTDNVGVTEYEIFRDGSKIGSATDCTFTDNGFSIDTQYVYTVKARDAAGNISSESNPVNAYMSDVFTPSEPGDLACTAQTESSVTLTWSASTDNIEVAGYEVYRDANKIGETTDTTYTDNGNDLSFGNTYVYTVKAKDTSGNVSNASAALSVKIEDVKPPSAPSDLACIGHTEKTVTLSWTAANDNIGVAKYDIYRDGTQIGSTAELVYTDRGLAIKTYVYTVKAQDTEGNVSKTSNTLSVTTADITAPSVPADLKCTSKTDTSVTFEWTASTDNGGIAGYDIYKDGTKVESTTGTSYTVGWLTTGQVYSFYIKARDMVGNTSDQSNSISVLCDSTAPSAPGNLACISQTDSSGTISWNASTDNIGVASYDVYRDGAKIDSTTSTTYTDYGIFAGSYTYSVKAKDAADNESGFSSALNVAITDTNPPTMGWVTPTNNTTRNYEVFTLTANGVYDPAGVSSVLFSIYNVADGASSYLTYPGDKMSMGVWNASFDASKYTTKTGTFILTVRGTDTLGNTSVMGSSQFIISSSSSYSSKLYEAPMALMEASSTESQTDIKTSGGTVTVNVNGISSESSVRMVLHGISGKTGQVISAQGVTVSLTNQGNSNWSGTFNVTDVMGSNKGIIQIDLIETDTNGIQTDLGYYTVTV
jgi:chitodextrinase